MVRCYHLYIMSLGLFLARSRHSILRTCSSRNRIFANAFTLNSRARISFNKLTTTSHVPRIGSIDTTLRHLSTQSNDDHSEDHVKKKKTSKGKARKFTINKNVGPEAAEALAAAFDDLARKDGFDGSMARMADDETFEDAFEDEDFLVMDEEEDDDDDDDDGIRFDDEDDILDIKNFDVSDFDEETVDKLDDDDDFLDFGGDRGDSMEARIAAAQQDMISGRVTVPEELDRFSSEEVDLSKLGFEREMNPFGNDETPRKEQFKLITNASTCSACGSDFQKRNENLPGYLPPEKFDLQQKLAKIEEMQKLKEKAETSDWSPEDEVEYLIQTAGNPDAKDDPELVDIDIDAMADEMGLDLVKLASKKVICKRCHGLQNFGKVDDALRPGWSEEPTISQEKFRDLLKPISEKPAVVVALVDLFDFSGSVLRELDGIAGENPVILAANKVDLLPASMGKQRIENWVRRELEYVGVKSIANVGGAVRLVSCRTGSGVQEMLAKARSLAEDIDGDVYVVGAANAGKSTLINKILEVEPPSSTGKKMRAGNRNSFKGELTTSPLPGTTLKFIKVDIGDGKSLYDTPGLLVPGTLTQLLTAEELKIVCPKKYVPFPNILSCSMAYHIFVFPT
jgi:ribosome biogenesis GTPase A